MDKATPRINSNLREKYVGKTVRLVGKLVSLSGNSAVLQTTDNGQVLVHLNGESPWGTEYLEVVGQIEPDFSMREFKTTNFGNALNLDLADKVVEYSQLCPELFE